MQLQICNQRKFKDAILFSKHHSSAFYCPVDGCKYKAPALYRPRSQAVYR